MRDRRRLQTLIGILMIPVSLVPFGLYLRNTAEGRLLWTRATLQFFPPRLPEVRVAAAGSLRPYGDAVAVLVYHGIGGTSDAEGRFSLSVSRFGEQLASLRAAGMNFVTARELAERFERGLPPPPNAVMITFDDGRAEAMMLADPLLRQARAQATMFVITDVLDDPGIFYASRDALEGYARSGRWDLESHTAGLHDTQATSLGDLPLLTSLARDGTLGECAQGVREDLNRADATLGEITGHRPVAFAYPFGAYGGDRTNDVRIRATLRALLTDRYQIAFQQDDQATVPPVRCTDPRMELRRLDVEPWSGPQLLERIAAMQARTWPTPGCPTAPGVALGSR